MDDKVFSYWNSCSTSFFYLENWKGIPVPVEKNRGSRNSTSPALSMYIYVENNSTSNQLQTFS
jgi:hypothetical protein